MKSAVSFKVSVLYVLLVCSQASTAPLTANEIRESFDSAKMREPYTSTNYTSDGFILNRQRRMSTITPEFTTSRNSTTTTEQPTTMEPTTMRPTTTSTTTMSPPSTSATKTNKLACALCVIIIVNE